MNDRHPSGFSPPPAPAPDASYTQYASYEHQGTFAGDPLFGALPSDYDGGHSGQYDSTQWNTDAYTSADYSGYGYGYGTQQATHETGLYDSGSYDTTAWSAEGYPSAVEIPAQVSYDTTGQWDANAWNQTGQFEKGQFENVTYGYDTTGQWTAPGFETGTYDATAWNSGEAEIPEQEAPPAAEFTAAEFETAAFTYEPESEPETGPVPDDHHAEPLLEAELATAPAAPTPPRPARRAAGNRTRRRTPAKRSALLTVAVPSACVMGVAGIAAASVSGLGDVKQDDTTTQAAPDPASVKPVAANSKLDTQLAALSADADDFADRASRTQERIDLKERQAAEKKKREEEARRKELLRPKFALPVKQNGLSAQYGQAGVNWMSVHTGIDFPVAYGTPVMAATDGTVRTQWNSAYGNMAIVTARDGTETWYCHLSSIKFRSGTVKAGDVIAYSGNSGNSTGPHLHFEVRPGGGSAIDPLAWLRNHGLDPT
ncbi:M23 family metallopeptidase [Streptomyces sp. A3M-1-3]|uniref:M23 family metallopeptidase n=1 Tax=Streptomyces sp. A3M-1-3 TaxID=2962044 RepID=UPI0020B7C43A|nr:M23 family metallopeptidase [Streptomyces sp. A3M-1-3]MCP3818863.1 M23 family metallopeptidase [Streptomyces sp. A3M-1-3]